VVRQASNDCAANRFGRWLPDCNHSADDFIGEQRKNALLTKGSFVAYLSGIEQALAPQRGFLVGDNVTLADVCFVSELCLFHSERARISALKTACFSLLLDNEFAKSFPRSAAHFRRLLGHPAFVPNVAGYLEKIERNDDRVN
jgi:glutathione S-transferase